MTDEAEKKVQDLITETADRIQREMLEQLTGIDATACSSETPKRNIDVHEINSEIQRFERWRRESATINAAIATANGVAWSLLGAVRPECFAAAAAWCVISAGFTAHPIGYDNAPGELVNAVLRGADREELESIAARIREARQTSKEPIEPW